MSKLSRNTFLLGLVSFLNDVASEMVYPIVPLFLTGVLGASTGVLGVVEGVAEGFSDLLKLVFGRLSDKLKRNKRFVFTGYAIASAARPLMGLSTTWVHVFILRFLDRVGKGIRTSPRDKLIYLSQDSSSLGFAFSFHRAMDHLGAVLGPLVAYVLLSKPGFSIRNVFFLTAVPATFVMLLLAFVQEREGEVPVAEVPREGEKPVVPYMVSLFVFSLGNASDAFIVLLLSTRGFSVVDIPILWAAFHVVKSLLSTPFGVLSDRIGRKKVVVMGWLVYAISYFLFPFAKGRFLLLVLLIYGAYYAMTEGVEKALLGSMIKRNIGGYYGLFHFVKGFSLLFSSVLFGLLWERFGARVPFWFGAGCSLVALLILSSVREVRRV